MRKKGKIAFWFLLPFLIVFILFRLGPSIAGIFIGFTQWDFTGGVKFAGIANFQNLLKDGYFGISVKNTLCFLLITVPSLVILGLLFAALLNKKIKGRNLGRTIIFSPYVIMPAAVGIIWNWIFDNNFGIFNYYLGIIGIKPIEWLTSGKWALFSVSIVTVWSLVGYNMILYLAGLQGINNELYEAAKIDGANGFQTFIKLTVPMLRPVTSIIITLTLINTVQIFDQIYVMTGGGPGTATLTMVQYMYNEAFQNFNLGYGSAIGFMILLFLIILVTIQSKFLKSEV
jgi:multiple sugar transport system permease protein